MADEKDRFGDKMRDVEAAREDQWAHQRDQELLEKMRQKTTAPVKCPQCQKVLAAKVVNGVAMLACPEGHGAWLKADTLKNLGKTNR